MAGFGIPGKADNLLDANTNSTERPCYVQISPVSPAHMDWSKNFPQHFAPKDSDAAVEGAVTKDSGKKVEFADIGCGYGGLLVALSTVFPDTLMLG